MTTLAAISPTLSAFGRTWLMGKKKSHESNRRTTGPPEMGSGRRALGLRRMVHPESFGNASFSFQNLAERLRRLSGLLIADVGVAHGGADIFVAEQLLDFAQILSHVVKQDRRRAVAQPVGGDLPYPEGSASGSQPQIERPVGERSPRIPCKHKLRGRKGDPAGSQNPAAFKILLDVFPLAQRLA